MKKQYKTLNLFIAAVMLLVCLGMPKGLARGQESELSGVSAISVGSVTVTQGEEIEVPIQVSENPGLCFALISVEYSEELVLLEAKDEGLFPSPLFGNDLGANPYSLSWEMSMAWENVQSNGTLATLRFALADGAEPGVYTVKVTYDENNIFNLDLQNVFFDTVDGRIEIKEKSSFPVGAVVIGVLAVAAAGAAAVVFMKKRGK